MRKCDALPTHPAIDRAITELRRERLRQGLTQKDLGRIIGKSQSNVAKVEARTCKTVQLWTLHDLAEGLGMSLDITLKAKDK